MSTINYTYNVIVDRFRQFAAGHFQLRRFTHGEISQADLEKEAEWPWMHVKPRAINYSPGTRAFSFEIFISDLPRDKEDKTGYQAESITDCSLIFQDLINEIHLGQMFGDDVLLTRPVNSEPFVEQYTHTLTGVTGVIELSMDYDWSACSIPASWNYNTPTNSNSSGFGSLQFIESLEQNGVFVSLDNDVEAPGNSYYYGTNGAGVKGWYASQAGAGTVTSVGLTAGTGISVSGGPITSSGSITVTNSAPDQVVALTAGTGITTSGTYPNFTITNSAPSSGGTVTSVTATLPISSTGGATPNLSISAANGTTNGYLSSTDWTTFNNKQAALVSGTNIKTINGNSLLGSGNLVVGGTQVGFKYNISVYSGPNPLPAAASGEAIILFYDDGSGASFEGLSIHPTDANGLDAPSFILTELGKQPLTLFINSTSYTTFNNTQAVTFVGGAYRVTSNDYRGTDATTLHGQVGYFDFGTSNTGTVTSVAALTLGTTGTDLSSTVATGTTTPVITLNVPTASAANRGALSAADWSTFNGKQAALGFTAENTANKQNSLATDGTGTKYPTVDAVNSLSIIDKGKRMVSFFTDFLTNATLDGAQSFASGGSLGLIVGAQIPNRTNQQGVAFFQSNTVATNYINYCSSSGVAQLWFGGGAWNYEALININTLSDASNRYRMIFGFGSVISNSAETNGVFITYDEGGTANGTAASPNWQCVTVDNSVRTLTTSTTAVTASAWNKLRIEINAAGTSVTFYVNGTAIATHTTNIPLASNSRYVIMKTGLAKTIGTTTRGFYCDYIGYENILTTAR